MNLINQSAINLIQSIGNDIQFVFFDRDGVINKLLPGRYVTSIDEFELLPESLSTIATIQSLVKRTFIVTNQQGIGKGIMTHDQLESIHSQLRNKLKANYHTDFDQIYYAPQLAEEQSKFRKPNNGMALQAQADFPEVDFTRSLMLGDSRGDYLFAKKSGMKFIQIENMQGWKPDDLPYVRSLEVLKSYLK